MTQKFRLARIDGVQIAPGCGESLGGFLAAAAEQRETTARMNAEARVEHWGDTVAQVYYLAAEAYERGAAVCGGHNRADLYHGRACHLRVKANSILTEAKTQRDTAQAERMKAAFATGYEGGDASRYSFEARAAFIVGAHFAANGLPMPALVTSVRLAGASDCIEADGARYAVNYPGGKINEVTVTLVAGGEG